MDLGEVVFIFYQSLLSSVGKLAFTQNICRYKKQKSPLLKCWMSLEK